MKHLKRERGQSLVELAISITILIFLLAGAVEFGMAFFQFVQLRDAAQEGALYGSIHPNDPATIETRIRGSSNSPIDLASGDVTIIITVDGVPIATAITNGDACEGAGLEVAVSYDHQIFMPFIPALLGGNSIIPLNATVTDTILTPVCTSP